MQENIIFSHQNDAKHTKQRLIYKHKLKVDAPLTDTDLIFLLVGGYFWHRLNHISKEKILRIYFGVHSTTKTKL